MIDFTDEELNGLIDLYIQGKSWVSEHRHRINDLANQYWILDGSPNGEEYRDCEFGKLKIKDIHWRRAEIAIAKEIAEIALSHNGGGDW